MNPTIYKLSIIILLLAGGFGATAQSITEPSLRAHIGYLASDKLKGRAPGTKGEQLAIQYIQKHFRSYGLKPQGEKGYLQPFTYRARLSIHDTIGGGKRKNGSNVIGFLDNGAASTIVIGAHFDHLGNEGHESSLDTDKKQVHNGADDNASGTAGVLELARYYAGNNIKEPCNFLFICFSGEEDGLVGSKYFTNHPTFKLENVRCMINMDMIGRLSDSTKKIVIYGVGTSPAYTKVFTGLSTGLHLTYDSSGIGPSDQTSFYLKNIPVLHFFTGQHHDYHRASDDADKINYAGEQEVLELIVQVSDRIAREASIPFTATRQNETKVSFKVTLGVMPDYTFEGKGMRIDAVTDGKPAANAGMKAGDVIVQMGDVKVTDVYAYMKALGTYKKGDTAEVDVLRNNEPLRLKVTF